MRARPSSPTIVPQHELRSGRHIIAIDGLQLRELDFVDIGDMIQLSGVVPVVIKSLLSLAR